MTAKTQPNEWKELCFQTLRILGILFSILLMIWSLALAINSGDYPRLVKLEYHWTQMEGGWIYSPTDVDLSSVSGNEPLGGIKKTDDGAWRAVWRWKPCGPGEYLSRELAEKCVENAAENYGFFGYVVRTRKHADDWKDVKKEGQ